MQEAFFFAVFTYCFAWRDGSQWLEFPYINT